MWEIRFARYTAKWSLKKRLVTAFGGGAFFIAVIMMLNVIMAGYDHWELQEPKYPVGVENVALTLIGGVKVTLIKKGFDKDGLVVSFFRILQKPFYESAIRKVPSTDGERVYWRWMYNLTDQLSDDSSEGIKRNFAMLEQYFDVVAFDPIGNVYLDTVWRYSAIEYFSSYLLKHIDDIKLSPFMEKALKQKIIRVKLHYIDKMDIEKFLIGKYSPMLQEKVPMSDEDKYMPLLFLLNTYHILLSSNFTSCNDTLIDKLIPLQNRILKVVELYNNIGLSARYKGHISDNIGYIEKTFPKTTKTLKDKCNIHA